MCEYLVPATAQDVWGIETVQVFPWPPLHPGLESGLLSVKRLSFPLSAFSHGLFSYGLVGHKLWQDHLMDDDDYEYDYCCHEIVGGHANLLLVAVALEAQATQDIWAQGD